MSDLFLVAFGNIGNVATYFVLRDSCTSGDSVLVLGVGSSALELLSHSVANGSDMISVSSTTPILKPKRCLGYGNVFQLVRMTN